MNIVHFLGNLEINRTVFFGLIWLALGLMQLSLYWSIPVYKKATIHIFLGAPVWMKPLYVIEMVLTYPIKLVGTVWMFATSPRRFIANHRDLSGIPC